MEHHGSGEQTGGDPHDPEEIIAQHSSRNIDQSRHYRGPRKPERMYLTNGRPTRNSKVKNSRPRLRGKSEGKKMIENLSGNRKTTSGVHFTAPTASRRAATSSPA